jgi:hypothetical protein
MAITIPSNAVKTFEKLIGAMGGRRLFLLPL